MEPEPRVKDQGLAEAEETPAAVDKAVVLELARKGIAFARLAA
jgi:hypothetical protein